ncbi:MAG: protein kinase [Acidobacteria bacterium]|nr:protein kinase [Acidobacteriota bacterium]
MDDQGSNIDGLPTAGKPKPPSLYVPVKPQLPDVVADRFEILGEIGEGGMGIVYKARDREAVEIVALKILRPEIAANESMMRRFKNEVRLARKITHKNVCRIHDLNRFESTYFISMEFVEGETLRDVLKRFGALGTKKGIQVAEQICAGLREAHAQGVVHRDLKPENIMFDRAGNVRIMDFGIARSLETKATTMAIVGTPAYMAPEQAQGRAADHRADIYSFGLILYEMFTGSAAFTADTPIAVALKQVSEKPLPPRQVDPSLPAHLERTILRCLEKDPGKRFQSIDELASMLLEKGFWTPAPRTFTAQDRAPQMLSWQRSDWMLLGSAAVALAVTIALFPELMVGIQVTLPDPPQRLWITAPALLAFVLFMFVIRGLHRQEPVPSTLRVAAVIGLGAAAAIPIPEYAGPGALPFKIGMPMLGFFVTFVVVHCVITTVLHYGHRRCPDQIAGYQIFFTEKLVSVPVGLELLRGILAGVIFVGLWMLLTFIAGQPNIPLSYWLQKAEGSGAYRSYINEFFPILIFMETLIVTWVLVAFPLTVFAGGIRRLPSRLTALAALWIVLGFSMAGPMLVPAPRFEVFAALQAIFLGLVFFRYGITAVGTSILTIEVFLLAYPLFRIQQSQSWQHAIPIGVWLLTVLGAALILLRPQLQAAYRRIVSMLE